MTRDELDAYVWENLSARKLLAGRDRVRRITTRALRSWPVAVLSQCDAAESMVVGNYMSRNIERSERHEYGMGFFAAVVFSAIIGEIVKVLLRRWLSSMQSRQTFLELCR